jgi:hypothetical protein
VVALDQLGALGLSARAVGDRVTVGRMHRGVYAVGHMALSREGASMAAVLACGAGAVLSHRSAGALLGLRPDARPVTDVTTPSRRLRGMRGIARHTSETLRDADVTNVEGIPCTSAARTLLDLAEQIDRQGLRRACNQAEVLRTFDGRKVADVLARAEGRRGAVVLQAVLTQGRVGEAITRSGLEEDFLSLCVRAELPPPEVNGWIPLPGGDAKPDFLWPDRGLIAETDGRYVHTTQAAFEADRRGDQRLMRAGHRVVRFTRWQVRHAPNEVVETLRVLLER